MRARTARTLAVVAVVAVAATAVAVRLYHLTASNLWMDEGGSLQQSSGASFWATLSYLAHTAEGDHFQPLYFALLYLWRAIAGSSVFSLRVPSVLFSLAALTVIALTAARVFGRLHALLAATLVAVSAFFVIHAQEARPYALLLFLGALLLLLFVRVREQRTQRPYPPASWAFWVCFGVGAFASITVAIMAAGLALGDALVDRHPRRWLRTWLPCAVAALPALGFYLLSSAVTHPRDAGTTHLSGSLVRNAVFAVYGILAGTTYGPPLEGLHGPNAANLVLSYWPSLLVLATAAILALVATLLVIRGDALSSDERSVSLILLIAFVTSYALMFVFAFATNLNWQPRHSFFLALPLFLLLPLAARGGRSSRHTPWQIIGCVALGVIVLANVYSLGHLYWNAAYARDDYRAVARYVDENAGRRSVLLFGYPGLLRYYGDNQTLDGRGLPQDRLAESVRSLTGGAPRVLLISNREWAYWRQPQSIVEAMSAEYRFEGSVQFAYLTLYRFSRR
jgi:Dolichyl-phosphate-mannose-protein mannosyltransferase